MEKQIMTAITIEIEEPLLRRFEKRAQQEGRSTSDVIHEVLLQDAESDHVSSEQGRECFLEIPPLELGKMLMPIGSRSDWYDEMLDRSDD
jgi:hypothetical protein